MDDRDDEAAGASSDEDAASPTSSAASSQGEIQIAGHGDELAPLSRRAAAATIDWLLFFFIGTAMTVPFVTQGADGEAVANRWANLAWLVVIAATETIGVFRWGKTPGKALLGIKVVSTLDGKNPSLLWSFLRIAPVITAMVVVPFPFYLAVIASFYLTAMSNVEQRSLLDRFARTAVVTT